MAGRKTGRIRPYGVLKYDSLEDVQAGIDAYFAKAASENRPLTMQGLANALGLERETLLKYGCEDKYSNAIMSARAKVLEYAEERLFDKQTMSGAKFWLVNNGGYSERNEEDVFGSVYFIDDY
ncbi:MAG: terminase small subunit [Oscillospiraceae bacterium]|jgi:hypothetical protein